MADRDDVIAAANAVFLQYGFRRTTMGDLAEAARMSRPALYLVFPSKEHVFGAVLEHALDGMLAEVRVAVAAAETPRDKLLAALDGWFVRIYVLTHAAPGAKDLYESSLDLEVVVRANAAFDAIVAAILAPLVGKGEPSARELARMISGACIGFKATTKHAKQLRATMRTFVAVILASVNM